MMAMIGQSDLDHWDCPLNVLESDAIDRRHLATCRKPRRRLGAFPFSLGFFVQSAPERPNVHRAEWDFHQSSFGIQQYREPRDKTCPERAEGWVPRYL